MSGKKGQELGLSVRPGIQMVLEEVTGRNTALNGAEEGVNETCRKTEGQMGTSSVTAEDMTLQLKRLWGTEKHELEMQHCVAGKGRTRGPEATEAEF